jgi:hypothetical protein
MEFARSTPKLSNQDSTPQLANEESAEFNANSPTSSNFVSEMEENKSIDQNVTSSNEVAHLSFRLFLGLIIVEAFLIAAYFNQ